MESRNLPDAVEATFGIRSRLSVKTLTPDISATLLHTQHSLSWPVFAHPRVLDLPHSILRFVSQNYYSKSRIPEPDPSLTGGLGQQ
jgi:hypothetical protein